MAESSNFAFLKEHDPVFFQLASTAEQAFASDPNSTLIKLRQLGETLAPCSRWAAAAMGALTA